MPFPHHLCNNVKHCSKSVQTKTRKLIHSFSVVRRMYAAAAVAAVFLRLSSVLRCALAQTLASILTIVLLNAAASIHFSVLFNAFD